MTMSPILSMLMKARRVVLRRGVPLDEADDVVQEAFARLEAYERAHEVRSREAFLITAAVNIGRDQARRRTSSPIDVGSFAIDRVRDEAPTPEEVVRAQERLRRANAGLNQLDPKVRRALLAKRVEGLTYAEIAAEQGATVAAVEKQVARALVFLTRWMEGW